MKKQKEMIIKGAKAIKDEISLTLMVLSFLLITGTGLLQVFDKVKSTGPFMELFLTCCGLYFGRSFVKQKNIKKEEKQE